MTDTAEHWHHRPPTDEPRRTADQWEIADISTVRKVRQQILVTAAPAQPPNGPATLTTASERLAAVFAELASNALRHGHGPVTASLERGHETWLLSVFDSMAHKAPTPRRPVTDKPGGLGLSLVALLSDRVGWCTTGHVKRVWAEVRDEAPAALVERLHGAAAPPDPAGSQHGDRGAGR